MVVKSDFSVREIGYDECESIVSKHHYTGTVWKKDEMVEEYRYHGLFHKETLIGATQYASFCEPKCDRKWLQQYYGCHPINGYRNFWELARLAVADCDEHNITSWFLSRSMKMLNADYICTVSDPRMHDGVIYSATNWTYHGKKKGREEWLDSMMIPFSVWSKIYNKDIEQYWEKKPLDFNW